MKNTIAQILSLQVHPVVYLITHTNTCTYIYRVIENDCQGHTQYTPCDFFLWGYVKDKVFFVTP